MVGVRVMVRVGVRVMVGVLVKVRVGVGVNVGVIVGVKVRVSVGVKVGVLVGVMVGVLVGVGVGGAHVLSSTDTLLEPLFATTRSGLPSLLKSPTATETGLDPTEKLVAAVKPPVPLPRSTDTSLAK